MSLSEVHTKVKGFTVRLH